MTETNPNTPAMIPAAEQKTAAATRQEITTIILEEHPTPVAIGAEAPPSVSLELSASGPFGAY